MRSSPNRFGDRLKAFEIGVLEAMASSPDLLLSHELMTTDTLFNGNIRTSNASLEFYRCYVEDGGGLRQTPRRS